MDPGARASAVAASDEEQAPPGVGDPEAMPARAPEESSGLLEDGPVQEVRHEGAAGERSRAHAH
eukprot:3606423-Lingulodinium_polyedra.AAC.1